MVAIFDDVGKDRMRAASRTLGYLATTADGVPALAAHALDLAVSRAVDTHDLKLPVAAFEDAARVSPAWRGRYLAACTARFRGRAEPRAPIADRIDEIARGLT